MSTSTGPLPAGARDVERRLEHAGQLLDVLDEPRVLDDRHRDPGRVDLLECVGADQRRPHLAGDADERRRVHPRVGDRRDEVRRARAGRRDRDADLARSARVTLGHVPGALLVPREHVPHGRPARDRVVESAGSRRPGCRSRPRPLEPREHRRIASEPSIRAVDSTPDLVEVLDVGARLRQQVDHGVGEAAGVVAARSRCGRPPVPTARSSVRDAARRFSPSASISDAVSSMPSRIDDAEAARAPTASHAPGANTPGPLVRQPARARPMRREPAKCAAASVDGRRRRCASVTTTSSALRLLAQPHERLAERRAPRPAMPRQRRLLVLDGGAPRRVESPTATTRPRRDDGAGERAPDRDRVRPVAHRPAITTIAGRLDVHARDAPRELPGRP